MLKKYFVLISDGPGVYAFFAAAFVAIATLIGFIVYDKITGSLILETGNPAILLWPSFLIFVFGIILWTFNLLGTRFVKQPKIEGSHNKYRLRLIEEHNGQTRIGRKFFRKNGAEYHSVEIAYEYEGPYEIQEIVAEDIDGIVVSIPIVLTMETTGPWVADEILHSVINTGKFSVKQVLSDIASGVLDNIPNRAEVFVRFLEHKSEFKFLAEIKSAVTFPRSPFSNTKIKKLKIGAPSTSLSKQTS